MGRFNHVKGNTFAFAHLYFIVIFLPELSYIEKYTTPKKKEPKESTVAYMKQELRYAYEFYYWTRARFHKQLESLKELT